MKIKIECIDIISNINRNLMSKINSEELEFMDKCVLSVDEEAADVIRYINKFYPDKFIWINDTELHEIFKLDILQVKSGCQYKYDLFNHIFNFNEVKFSGKDEIDFDDYGQASETIDYTIHQDYIETITKYFDSMVEHYHYYFKINSDNTLVLPGIYNWEVDVDPDDLIDCKETRELLLKYL